MKKFIPQFIEDDGIHHQEYIMFGVYTGIYATKRENCYNYSYMLQSNMWSQSWKIVQKLILHDVAADL